MKVVMLSALRTGRLYQPVNIPGTHFCQRLSQPQGHSAIERIMSMKNSNNTIENRTRDLPGCRAVRQPNAPPLYPKNSRRNKKIFSSPKRQDQLLGRTQLLFNSYRGNFPDIKQPGRYANHLHPSNTEVKQERSYATTYVIQDFHCDVNQIFALQGCYAGQIWAVSYRRFGTTFDPILKDRVRNLRRWDRQVTPKRL